MNKKILLVKSGEKSNLPRVPLEILELASWIRKNGYEPTILDTRITNWITNDWTFPFEEYLTICISSYTGPDLKEGIHISQYVKKYYPKIPIIWGGHYVSSEPEQAINNNYIDAIVVGEGEIALLNILKSIENKTFKKGVYYQEIIDMDKLDITAYDLVNINNYLDGKSGEVSYPPTRGCFNRCRFCYNLNFHKQKHRRKSIDKIISEIEKLKGMYHPKKIKLVGDNFFANKKQALDLLKKLKDIKWSSTIRIDCLSRFTDEEMQILKDSGCWLLALGAESGSQKILDYLHKDITPEQTLIVAEKCSRYGILPVFSMMIGIPGEEWEDVLQTLDLYDRIDKIKGTETNGLFIFDFYNGVPIYDEAEKWGYKKPSSIEEWSNIKLLSIKRPWHDKMGPSLETISKISRFKYFYKHMKYFSKESVKRKTGLPNWLIMLGIIPFRISAFIRWKLRFFKLGYEWNLFFKMLSKYSEIY